jgi:hypothetical protein
MKKKWKIFRVINIVEAILIASFFCYALSMHPPPMHGAAHLTGFALSLILLVAVILNCTNNYSTLHFYLKAELLEQGKKVLFWILYSLFALFTILFSYLVFYFTGFVTLERILVYIDILVIFMLGIYILVFQVVLFITIKKEHEIKLESTIHEIGKAEEE